MSLLGLPFYSNRESCDLWNSFLYSFVLVLIRVH